MRRVKSQLERDLDKFADTVKSADLNQIIHRKSETKQLWNENANVYHYRYQRLRNHLNEQDFMLPQSPDFYPRFDKASKKYFYAPPTTNHYSHRPTFSSYMNTQFSGHTEHTQISLAQRSPSSVKIRNLKHPYISLQTPPIIPQSNSTPTPLAQSSPKFTLPASPANSKAPKHSYFMGTASFRKSESNLAQLYRQHTEFDKPMLKVINDESPSMFKEFSCIRNRMQRSTRTSSGNKMSFEVSTVQNNVS